MSTKKRGGLGKGLEALLGATSMANKAVTAATELNENELRHLSVEFIQPGKYQPRRDINAEALAELTASIKAQGIIQPIVVRSIANGHYEIIAGERRWRAAQLAGLAQVPVLIREMPDNAAMAVALIENIQREDLNPIEEAIALQRLLDEFSMTHQQVAEAVGKSRATVSNLLRLLSLQDSVKQFVQQGKLEMGHARALLSLEDDKQINAAEKIIAGDLSVRETEELVKRFQTDPTSTQAQTTAEELDPMVEELQNQLTAKLGKQALIQHKTNGKGKVVLHYRSLLELRAILSNVL